MKKQNVITCLVMVVILITMHGIAHSNQNCSLCVDDNKVGIGTSSPTRKLHLHDSSLSAPVYTTFTNDSTTAGDQCGVFVGMGPSNEANLIAWETDSYARIWTGGAERMRIDSTGKVGIGTTNPGSYKLYVAGSAYSTGEWSGSDERWKKNIEPLEDSLDKVNQLQGVSYNWRVDEYPDEGFTNKKQVGLIAQDVERIIPELVQTNHNGYKSISYEKLTAVLVEAIKELKTQNEELIIQVKELREHVEELE